MELESFLNDCVSTCPMSTFKYWVKLYTAERDRQSPCERYIKVTNKSRNVQLSLTSIQYTQTHANQATKDMPAKQNGHHKQEKAKQTKTKSKKNRKYF